MAKQKKAGQSYEEEKLAEQKSERQLRRRNSILTRSYVRGAKDGVKRNVILLQREGSYYRLIIEGRTELVKVERVKQESGDLDLLLFD